MGGGRIGLIFGPLGCMLVYKIRPHKPDSAWQNPSIQQAAAPGVTHRLLDRRLPAAEQIYGHLREEIITCRLAPNEALSENRICGMFGVSRSPVRIALTRLAEDGLIDIFPQRGSFVAPIRMKQVQESQFARAALEVALVEVAAEKWTRGACGGGPCQSRRPEAPRGRG